MSLTNFGFEVAKNDEACYSAIVNFYHEQMLVLLGRTSILLTRSYGTDEQAEGKGNSTGKTA